MEIRPEHPPVKESYIRRKLRTTKDTIFRLLKTGLTPQKLSHAVTVGFIAGLLPIYGTHMVVGISCGLLLRLNQPALIIGIFVSFPFYLLLLFPFLRLGEFLVGAPMLQLSEFNQSFKLMFQSWDVFWQVLQKYMTSFIHMNLGWLVGSVFLYFPLYWGVLRLIKSYDKIRQRNNSVP